MYNDRKETLHCDGACALKREPFVFYLQSGHSSSALHLGPSLFCRTRLRLSCMQKFCIYNKLQISYKVSRLIIWKVLVELFEFIKYEPFFRSHGNFIVISHKQRMNLPSQWLILEDTYFFCLGRDCTSQPWMKKRNLGTWGISKGQWTRSPVSNRMDSESLFQRRHREPQRLVATNPFWIYHTNTRVSERIFFPIFPSTGVLCIIDVTIIIPWHLFPSLFVAIHIRQDWHREGGRSGIGGQTGEVGSNSSTVSPVFDGRRDTSFKDKVDFFLLLFLFPMSEFLSTLTFIIISSQWWKLSMIFQ